MKCPKCKFENPETQRFCGECGTQLGSSEGPQLSKTLYKKSLDLWKDAHPGRPDVEDARKRLAGLSKS